MVRETAKDPNDSKEYVSRAKEYVRILDELMRSDPPPEPTRKDR